LNTVIAAIADQNVDLMAKLTFIDPEAPPWERVELGVYQVIPTSGRIKEAKH